jgi:hypothetical protein
MPWFRALVRGENFLVDVNGETKRFGFYTTRFIEADAIENAEIAAVEAIRGDKELRHTALNERNDPPLVFVEEIHEILKTEIPSASTGFTFFPAESE